MPEDIIEEVSELEEIEEDPEKEVPETEHDETSAFESDNTEAEKAEESGIEVPKEEPEGEIKAEEEEKEGEEEELESEEDEDIARGKELIDETAAVKKEIEERETKEEAKEEYSPFTVKYTREDIETFQNVIPENLLPDTAILPDGTELDFKEVLEPEIPIAAAAIANNIVQQLVANGYLVSGEQLQAVNQAFDDKLFIRTLTNKADGVPKALEIYKSDGFKAWFKDQGAEITALMDSGDPKDHIRVFKRFLGQAGKDEADEKIKKIDGKRKKAKEKFDAIHKTTVKNKGPAKKKSGVSPEDEERAGFDEKDSDDDFFS